MTAVPHARLSFLNALPFWMTLLTLPLAAIGAA